MPERFLHYLLEKVKYPVLNSSNTKNMSMARRTFTQKIYNYSSSQTEPGDCQGIDVHNNITRI